MYMYVITLPLKGEDTTYIFTYMDKATLFTSGENRMIVLFYIYTCFNYLLLML